MGDVLKIRDEYRQIQWAVVIQECKASGLTNKEYCIQHGLSEKTSCTWGSRPHEELEAFMPWAPYIPENCKIPNSDAYVNTYLE